MNRFMLYSLLAFSLLSTGIGKANVISDCSKKLVELSSTAIFQGMATGAVISTAFNFIENDNFIKANFLGATTLMLIDSIKCPTRQTDSWQIEYKQHNQVNSATLLGYIFGTVITRKLRAKTSLYKEVKETMHMIHEECRENINK